MQKSLQGIDNVTAEGTEAIDNLITMMSTLSGSETDGVWLKETEKQLKDAKRYLKTDFKTHVERESKSADHCVTHALSDTKNEAYQSSCLHSHDDHCDRCEIIDDCFQKVESQLQRIEMNEEERSQLMFDFKQCTTAIRAWKSHLLRTVVQEDAKQDAMKEINDEICLVIIDWAMKFLLIK